MRCNTADCNATGADKDERIRLPKGARCPICKRIQGRNAIFRVFFRRTYGTNIPSVAEKLRQPLRQPLAVNAIHSIRMGRASGFRCAVSVGEIGRVEF